MLRLRVHCHIFRDCVGIVRQYVYLSVQSCPFAGMEGKFCRLVVGFQVEDVAIVIYFRRRC